MQDGLMSSSSRAARTRSCGLALQASESPTSHREIEDGPRKAKKHGATAAASTHCAARRLRAPQSVHLPTRVFPARGREVGGAEGRKASKLRRVRTKASKASKVEDEGFEGFEG